MQRQEKGTQIDIAFLLVLICQPSLNLFDNDNADLNLKSKYL
jgi:hypothetical protein